MNILCLFCIARKMTKTSVVFRSLPVVLSFAALILVMLALFAGNKPGILEDYDIITVSSYCQP